MCGERGEVSAPDAVALDEDDRREGRGRVAGEPRVEAERREAGDAGDCAPACGETRARGVVPAESLAYAYRPAR